MGRHTDESTERSTPTCAIVLGASIDTFAPGAALKHGTMSSDLSSASVMMPSSSNSHAPDPRASVHGWLYADAAVGSVDVATTAPVVTFTSSMYSGCATPGASACVVASPTRSSARLLALKSVADATWHADACAWTGEAEAGNCAWIARRQRANRSGARTFRDILRLHTHEHSCRR